MTKQSPLIGITTYGANEKKEFTLPVEYVACVRRAGGIPVLVPPGEPQVEALLGRLDGVVLAGGGDICPSCYGGVQHVTVYNVDSARDQMELALAMAVIERDVPTLAICRGIQIVNVALGGTLHPHLPDVVGEDILHRAPPRKPIPHAVRVFGSSRLASIMATANVEPMSWHHQALRDVAPGLDVVAEAPDGVIEAVEMAGHRWLVGVQWHPELTAEKDPTQQRLFDELLRQSAAQ